MAVETFGEGNNRRDLINGYHGSIYRNPGRVIRVFEPPWSQSWTLEIETDDMYYFAVYVSKTTGKPFVAESTEKSVDSYITSLYNDTTFQTYLEQKANEIV